MSGNPSGVQCRHLRRATGPHRANMAAPGEFERWLNSRLDSLEVDRDVYGSYILGVLQEEDSEDEKMDAIQGILSAFLEEDALEDVCTEIIKQWLDSSAGSKAKNDHVDAEVQAIASLIEKQAQIVVKQKEVSEEEKKRKAALLAQYANITDDEAYPLSAVLFFFQSSFFNTSTEDAGPEESGAAACTFDTSKSLFKNTNLEDVMNAKKVDREKAREDSHKKKEQDKMQREKDKLLKQERKDKEKKRTQKGERKR
ncbi:coiled-coil domain-containing protein 43-like isoform X1 [Acipenser ruthenus]|uniref:coiled-coil domain-containing protein 43-like isoform X1 n=1 Tax=Acipenser ruthenus TaxID=7906 RepID=UPI00274149D1|nr:coiled-coil domain-containing protein 43-like isoform X1 [Acipenser ruthenus]